ncbi:response regulator, partial [Mammaliicoccus sciuri]|nr:response regulator [Mammaliicoccus sciuri]
DLPGLQGDALLRHLRDNPQTRELPVITISAAPTPEDIANISALGIAGYLTKPLKLQTLREAVQQLCGRARQAS